jgi:hypothetical protein
MTPAAPLDPPFRAAIARVFSFPVFLAVALAASVYHFANHGIADPDLWWHLRNAQYLLESHHFIRVDMYSFTVLGQPWMDHEWLGEIPYYLAWKVWGFQGIFLLMVCLIEVTLLGTFWLASMVSGNVKAAFIASWVAVWLATVSFGPRVLHFGWIFLVLLLALLWRYKEEGKDHLWWIPLLFLVWVNTHGSWLIGVMVLVCYVAGGLLPSSSGMVSVTRWSPSQLRKLLRVTGLSLAALFVNPYGYRLVLYPFDLMFRVKLGVGNVEEWASIDFHSVRGKILLAIILVMLLVTLLRGQRWKLEWLGLFCLGLYASVTYMRFLFLAAILFTPLLAQRLDFVPPYRRERDQPWLNALLMAAMILSMAARFPSAPALASDIALYYPTKKAIAPLQSLVREQPGRVLNDYLWGGYLIWNCPDVPVFIDSRVDIFEYHGIFREYMDFATLHDPLERLDQERIRYVFLGSHAPVTYLLKRVPNWKVRYSDDVAILFERVQPATPAADLGRLAPPPAPPPPPPVRVR